MAYYLMTPVLQMATGLGFITAVVLAVVTDLPLWASSIPILIFFLGLSFGPTLVGLLSRERSPRAVVIGVLTLVPYTVYSWLIFPVLVRALLRQLSGSNTWAKTAREPLGDDIVTTVDRP